MSERSVLTLGSGEAVLGPAVRVSVEVHQCVLLLDAEPRHVRLHLLHDHLARDALVRLCKEDNAICLKTMPLTKYSMQHRTGLLQLIKV